MIDTHCHIFDKAYNADRTETIARAQASGVTQLLMPNVDRGTYSNMMSVAKQFPAVCKPMIGVHPTSISAASVEDDFRFVQHELEAQPVGTFVAMGEIGIDCYHSREFLAEQIFAFEKLLRLAEKFQLPVVIHARDSFNEIMEVLRRVHPKVSGVFHAFSSSIEMYHEVKKMGDYKFGIGGVVTFKNAKLAEVVQHIPLSDILLETDAPYLTPTPHRGTRNESSYLTFVAQKIAELKGVSAAEVDEITTENATKLFRL